MALKKDKAFLKKGLKLIIGFPFKKGLQKIIWSPRKKKALTRIGFP